MGGIKVPENPVLVDEWEVHVGYLSSTRTKTTSFKCIDNFTVEQVYLCNPSNFSDSEGDVKPQQSINLIPTLFHCKIIGEVNTVANSKSIDKFIKLLSMAHYLK